jgi:hypothetical protein
VDVLAQRRQWTQEQAALVAEGHAEASTVISTAGDSVARERSRADGEATELHQRGQHEAAEARREGEREAAQARQEGERESSDGGFFSWAASAVTALVDKVKNGVKAAFDKATAAVRAAIQKAQQLAAAVIEKARQAVVAAIAAAGAALIAIGNRVLGAFPGLRDRFEKAIKDRVAAAQAAVNRVAEGMKRGIKAALDLLGRGLDAALGLLQKGMLAAVDAVKATVKGALDFAKKAIAALGIFAVLAKDIAKGPGRWVSMLGSSVVNGIRLHLWTAFKASVKEWFNSKVEEVTGFGQFIWNLLKRGGIALGHVAKMVWQGIVAAIPSALIAILVEKLVSMVVPAAGAVLIVIQSIQAAWGTIQRVIQAVSAFVAFLKGVLTGGGPVLFAKALSATAIAVIEFVAQWLLKRLKGAATGVGGRLKAIAQRIGQRLKAIGKAVAGGAKKAAGAAMRAVKAVGRGIVSGAKAVGRGIARGARFLEKRLGRVGAAIGRGVRRGAAAIRKQWERVKAKFREWRDKLKKKWEAWKARAEERKAKRRARAEGETAAALDSLLTSGANSLLFRARLKWLQYRWGWTSLTLAQQGGKFQVMGSMSPERPVGPPAEQTAQVLVPPRVKIIRPGEIPLNPAAAELFEKSASTPRFGQPRGQAQPGWWAFEAGMKSQFGTVVAPMEGIKPEDVAFDSASKWLKLGTPASKLSKHGKPLDFFTRPEALGTGYDDEGKVNRLTLGEATLQADMTATGVYCKDGGRKLAQFRSYLEGLKLRRDQLMSQGLAAKTIHISVHYFSDREPGEGTVAQFEKDLKESGLTDVTVTWHRI